MTDPSAGFDNIGGGQTGQKTGAQKRSNGPILTGADFIASFIPPDWLIDGIVQRGRLYACTSITGHGKTAVWLFNACMVHAGRMVGQLDVFRGNVLILAGENPEDLKARMIGMASTYNIPPDQLPYVLPGSFPLDEEKADALKLDIAALSVPFVLIIGDTASSFFPGDDENSNVQAGGYARTLRSFTECDGQPAVVVLSHPVKNASRSNLLPRGGGAFLNELDGNFTLWSDSMGEVAELHWQGKIRGPNFSPFGYRLRPVPTGFNDRRARPVMTIVAEPMSDEAVADHIKQTLAYEDRVLLALRDQPGISMTQIARDAGWVSDDDKPEKWRVQGIIRRLADDKLVEQARKGAPWKLTDKGNEALGQPKAADTAPKDQPPARKPVAPPTEAEIDAEIARHNTLPEKLREPDRRIAAKRLGMGARAFEKLAKTAREAAAPVPAEASGATAPEPTEAEIERLAEMSDAAFLSIDRKAVAARLRCTPGELTTLRRRAQAAKVTAAKAQAAKKTVIVAKTIAARAKKAGNSKKDTVTTIITAKAIKAKPAKATATPRGKHPSPKDNH